MTPRAGASSAIAARTRSPRRRSPHTRPAGEVSSSHPSCCSSPRYEAWCYSVRSLADDHETLIGKEPRVALWKPDPTFYPSPKMAMQAPPEKLAYVAIVNPTNHGRPDALGVVDVENGSSGY